MKNRKKIANVPNLRFSNFTEEWEETRLGDNCDISMCKRIFANETHEIEEIPFYKIGTLGGKPDSFIRRELFEEYKSKYNYPEIGEVMITCSGTVGKCIVFNGEDSYYQDSNIVWINNPKKEISNEFLHYVLSNINWGKLNSTTITRIYSTDLKSLILKYPQNHNEQNKLVTLLSFLDNRLSTQIQIIEELKSLIKTTFKSFHNKVEKTEYKISDLGNSFRTMNLSKEDLSTKGEKCILYGELFTTYDCVIDEVHLYYNDIKNIKIMLPNLESQNFLADLMRLLRDKIQNEQKLLSHYTEQKKYLLVNMFI